jgi:hypothetical protein
MATREVKVGVMSYVNADGLNQFGLLGATVDVHPDDVERFDRLNVVAAPTPEPEPLVASADVTEPAGNASLAAWQDYARTQGATDADLDGKTRDELRDKYGS